MRMVKKSVVMDTHHLAETLVKKKEKNKAITKIPNAKNVCEMCQNHIPDENGISLFSILENNNLQHMFETHFPRIVSRIHSQF